MGGGKVGVLTGRIRKCCSPKEYHKNVFEYLEFVMKSKYMDFVRRIERGDKCFGTDKECVGRIRAKKDE